MSTKPEEIKEIKEIKEIEVELFIDFDGTVTPTAGEHTVNDTNYKKLKKDEKADYKKAEFKTHDEMVKIIQGREFPAYLKMDEKAVKFLKDKLSSNIPITINFVSKNRSEYILAQLVANSFSEHIKNNKIKIAGVQEISKLLLNFQEVFRVNIDPNNPKKDAVNILLMSNLNQKVGKTIVAGVWDDSKKDYEGMFAALKESNIYFDIVGSNTLPGQFSWDKAKQLLDKAIQSAARSAKIFNDLNAVHFKENFGRAESKQALLG